MKRSRFSEEKIIEMLRGHEAGRLRRHQPQLEQRAGIEAVIGRLKTDGHLGRYSLKGRRGGRASPVLSAARHNLRLLLCRAGTLLFLISTNETIPDQRRP